MQYLKLSFFQKQELRAYNKWNASFLLPSSSNFLRFVVMLP